MRVDIRRQRQPSCLAFIKSRHPSMRLCHQSLVTLRAVASFHYHDFGPTFANLYRQQILLCAGHTIWSNIRVNERYAGSLDSFNNRLEASVCFHCMNITVCMLNDYSASLVRMRRASKYPRVHTYPHISF